MIVEWRIKMPASELRSKAVFGSEYRLDLLCAIATAQPDDLYAKKLVEVSGAPNGQVSKDLNRLAEVGLLKRRPLQQGSRLVLYSRTSSALWDAVVAVRNEWRPRRK